MNHGCSHTKCRCLASSARGGPSWLYITASIRQHFPQVWGVIREDQNCPSACSVRPCVLLPLIILMIPSPPEINEKTNANIANACDEFARVHVSKKGKDLERPLIIAPLHVSRQVCCVPQPRYRNWSYMAKEAPKS